MDFYRFLQPVSSFDQQTCLQTYVSVYFIPAGNPLGSPFICIFSGLYVGSEMRLKKLVVRKYFFFFVISFLWCLFWSIMSVLAQRRRRRLGKLPEVGCEGKFPHWSDTKRWKILGVFCFLLFGDIVFNVVSKRFHSVV